jgi:hypothetical protein
MNRRHHTVVGLAGLAVLALAATVARAADDPPPLDLALRDNAPKIVEKLRAEKYNNVGVLKFLVDNGSGKPRDNVGPLNTSLADRLEVALVLALKDDSLGIIANASKGVKESANLRATHLTAKGRKELFEIDKSHFHVPWDVGADIEPDGFLTGVARLSADRRTLTVAVQLFDRKDPAAEPRTVCEFKAASDLRTLTETGVTFRGAGDGQILVAKVTEAAPLPDDKPDYLKEKAKLALDDLKDSPVELKILYDGRPQKVEAAAVGLDRGGVLLSVPTPEQGQKFSFELHNTTKDTVGVVLKLNGQNTIELQEQDALDCKKWILKGDETIKVSGYQLNQKDHDPFQVQGFKESAEKEVDYGTDVGTINLVVFRAGKEADVVVKNDVVGSISRGMLSLQKKAKNTSLERFQDQLKEESTAALKDARSGGLVTGSGDIGSHPVDEVKFIPAPVPVLSATIRYYEPKEPKERKKK